MRNLPKVLVVDDDKIIRYLFQGALLKEKCNVVQAGSGDECLNILKKDKKEDIKLVFLDLQMPGIDGEETLEKIKILKKNLPVFIFSGQGTVPDRLKLYTKKPNRYISKPIDIEYTRILVRNTLGGRKRSPKKHLV